MRQGLQQQLEPLEAQGSRVRHVSSHRETDMGALVNSLQQPQGHTSESQAECLSTLQELNTLRTMGGSGSARPCRQDAQAKCPGMVKATSPPPPPPRPSLSHDPLITHRYIYREPKGSLQQSLS